MQSMNNENIGGCSRYVQCHIATVIYLFIERKDQLLPGFDCGSYDHGRHIVERYVFNQDSILAGKYPHAKWSSTEVDIVSLATYAKNALPGRLPGQCASMHQKPSIFGVNKPYRVSRKFGHVAGHAVPTSVREGSFHPLDHSTLLSGDGTRQTVD